MLFSVHVSADDVLVRVHTDHECLSHGYGVREAEGVGDDLGDEGRAVAAGVKHDVVARVQDRLHLCDQCLD